MAAAQIITINPESFKEALQDLPLSSIYAKVSELRNAIAHLHRSNSEMRDFISTLEGSSEEVEAERREMEGYIRENEGVFTSMRERLGFLRAEIERRGERWIEEVGDGETQGQEKGKVNGEEVVNGTGTGNGNAEVEGEGDGGIYL